MTIVVEPNPANEGGQVTITVDGSGPYFYRNGGTSGDWQPLPIDPETGSVTIDVPGSPPSTLDISNRDDGAPDSISVPITATD